MLCKNHRRQRSVQQPLMDIVQEPSAPARIPQAKLGRLEAGLTLFNLDPFTEQGQQMPKTERLVEQVARDRQPPQITVPATPEKYH